MAINTTCCGSVVTGSSRVRITALPSLVSCPDPTDVILVTRGSVTYQSTYKNFTSCLDCECSSVSVAPTVKPYDLVFYAASVIRGNETLLVENIRRNVTIPENFSNSRATVNTAHSVTVQYSLHTDTASVTATLGTIQFNPNQKTGVFSTLVQTSLVQNQRLILRAPASAYGGKDFALTLVRTVRV